MPTIRSSRHGEYGEQRCPTLFRPARLVRWTVVSCSVSRMTLPSVSVLTFSRSQGLREVAQGVQDEDRAESRCVSIEIHLQQYIGTEYRFSRARYLRLPSAAPRQVVERPRASGFPNRMRSTSPTLAPSAEPVDAPVPPTRPFALRPGIASLLSARTKSPERPGRRDLPVPGSSRPKMSTRASTTRATSPARSQATSYDFAKDRDTDLPPKSRARAGSTASGGDIARSSLWHELRDMQLRARPFSDRARSIEPP